MDGIRKITPYIPGAQPDFEDMIKLNTNENAYPPSPKVLEALEKSDYRQLMRYPSLTNHELKEALAGTYGLQTDQLIIGNGSDEILAFCFLAFFNSRKPVLFPGMTYGFYKVWADLFHVPYQEIPLQSDTFEIVPADYFKENGGIIIANPNAPTGIELSKNDIRRILAENPEVVVVIDEAYCDYGDESVVDLIAEYHNLVVTHTFSKSRSLAGIRLGYAMGNAKLIKVLEAVKSSFNPYSVDKLAEVVGTAAVEDQSYYQEKNALICQTRDRFSEELAKLGFQTLPSKTNFVLTTHPQADAADLFRYLESRHIFVRYFKSPAVLENYLRISIGTDSEMATVIQVIQTYLQDIL